MPTPKSLKNGDTVAIVATAKRLQPNEIDGAIQLIESWGLNVTTGTNLYDSHHQFAGTDKQRAHDLQNALNDDHIKAVIFARGGYGTARIIDKINWSAFAQNPKWLCGFSDLTVLHSHVHQNLGIETLHSSMPIFFKDGVANPGSNSLQNMLFGNEASLSWKHHNLNRTGKTQGQLIGGNLSVLYSIMGTSSQMDFKGKILFIEDLCENLYHLDRMMMQLKRAGHLSQLNGLIVGQFTDMEDNEISFGKTADKIILDAVSEYKYPVAFNAPIGHVENNQAVKHGALTELTVDIHSSIRYE